VIPLGLSASTLAALNATLATHHQIKVTVQTLTLAGAFESDLSALLVDGQVNVDGNADVTRTATVTLLDPHRTLVFDSDSPADSALFLDRMLFIFYSVVVNGTWIDIPVFTGPMSKLDRSGDTVVVEAQGKEWLAMGACWRPYTLRKGMLATAAIRALLYDRAGEVDLNIPDLPTRLPRNISLSRESVPWVTARAIAHSLNRQLFYDGGGTCRLRPYPGTPLFTYTAAMMTGPLVISYGGDTINTVWVTGATPKGSKSAVTYTAVAAPSHPLSPIRLGRFNAPRYLLSVVQDDTIRSTTDAKTIATRQLNAALLQAVSVTFDALPIPHLEPSDVVLVNAPEGSVTFSLSTYSLPLTTSAPMTVGYMRNVSLHNRTRAYR
jgi:hypothetical protein